MLCRIKCHLDQSLSLVILYLGYLYKQKLFSPNSLSMMHAPLLISPSAMFWDEAARAIMESPFIANDKKRQHDYSALRVIVPTAVHIQQLKRSLASRSASAFIPPRINTLSMWLALQLPSKSAPTADSERLMGLYSELKQHAWLKTLFSAQRNTDLMPLAQTLLALCDELTQVLFPKMQVDPDAAYERWQAALDQLSPSARTLVSGEAQLVWSIWKTQLDANDPCAIRFAQMQQLAAHATEPLVWVSPVEFDAFETSFLHSYSQKQAVQIIKTDWRAATLSTTYRAAWPELVEAEQTQASLFEMDGEVQPMQPINGLSLYEAKSLEDEAQHAAQTIVDWLSAGKTRVAVIAQDRVVARRVRALLERAQIFVADETGWKLSTSRAAAAIAAWFDVVTTRAETAVLLDFLKSPFVFAELEQKTTQVMAIEMALRRANVCGGWEAVLAALVESPSERDLLSQLGQHAEVSTRTQCTLAEWADMTVEMLDAMGMQAALEKDQVGQQVITLLETIAQDCNTLEQKFSFAEWRAFVTLQLESTPFVDTPTDYRVAMLPLNGARLRVFDAVLMIGADAQHLPSQPQETLFFANGVRRELGLETRESRQREQMRDFAELLFANSEVVLSWQAFQDGEPNAQSPWIARLQLTLERAGLPKIPAHQINLPQAQLKSALVKRPAPSAPQLLPTKLSASAYNTLTACPYQFFATRMLGLFGLDELSDMPEKRDYGDWLHKILTSYHETIRDQHTELAQREHLLTQISEKIFEAELIKSPAALSYYVRWKKAIPAYLAWANQREAQGWQFVFGEKPFEKTLTWPEGSVTLHGRIDRIDHNESGEHAVLDYKTKTQQSLSARLKQLEDHQLAFYGMLSDVPVDYAHYVALEPVKEKTGDVEAPKYAEWQHALNAQVVQTMRAISQGAPLKAMGIESVCEYCDVRGLCRKGVWQ
jgi:ATP-dependent helicase/nuclease subunit B